MSDVASSSSSSTCSGVEEYSFEDTPNYFWRGSSRGSSEEDLGELVPSRETVGAALDKYVSASRGGREAYSNGDLYNAVKEFDKALDIELQTEMECLYDTSIGFMSGLVRNEVETRMKHHISDSQKCSKILDHLRGLYSQASESVRTRRTDTPQQHYLQMGAALVVINEWSKAKAVYTEGMNVCKDRKELKVALKNLIKIEQITSCAEIPAEDHPDTVTHLPSPDQSPAPQSPLLRPKHCNHSPRLKHEKSFGMSPRLRHERSPGSSPQLKRDRSMSLGLLQLTRTRDRTGSLNLEECSPSDVVTFNGTSSMMSKKDSSRLSFKIFNSKRRYSLAKTAAASSTSTLSPEETDVWGSCFKPTSCPVVTHTDFQPSAITHMRRLTVGGDGRDQEGDVKSPNNSTTNFNAVQFTSMKIEDDDSELDDSD